MKINKLLDKIFEIGVLVKAIFGFFEVLLGIIFAVSGKLILNNLIAAFITREIIEDPNDFFVNLLAKYVNNFSAGSYLFAVMYLIFHGIVNISLASALLRNKINIYPWAITGFSIFIIYQTYKYFYSHSLLLLAITVFDIFVVTVIILEYRRNYKKRKRFTEDENVF